MGNAELFELFETDPMTQCKECLSYWSEGIVYCTCGHLLKEIVANWGFIENTLDLLSIPEYVIKKGRPHGHRFGKTPEMKEYHLDHNLKKRCIKREFTGVHDRFLRDPDFRKSMLEHDRDEESLYQMERSCSTRFHISNDRIRIFSLQTKLVDLSHLVWKHWRTIEKTFWLQPSVVYIKPFTPRSWRTTTQAHALLEVPETATVIEFFLHLVAMEWILVVFLRIQRKSMKEDACKGLWQNGATRCLPIFGSNLRRTAFTNLFYCSLLCCR